MKKIIFLVIVGLTTVFSSYAQAPKKTGYVNVNDILAALPETKKANDDLEKYYKQLQDEYVALGKDLETKFKEFESKKSSMTPTMIEVKQKELQNLNNQLEEFQAKAQENVQKKESELLSPILKKINDAIEAHGKSKNFDFILNSNSIIFAKDAENVTADIKTSLGIK